MTAATNAVLATAKRNILANDEETRAKAYTTLLHLALNGTDEEREKAREPLLQAGARVGASITDSTGTYQWSREGGCVDWYPAVRIVLPV